MMPVWLEAGTWGLIAACGLLIGALLGWFLHFSARAVAHVMAFGSGILIAALSLDLVGHALDDSGVAILDGLRVAGAFMAGAIIYSLINHRLNTPVARHRKRSVHQAPAQSNNGMAIAVGTLLDAIPESIAIGLMVASGGTLSLATLLAIFISNVPEALSSTSGMRRAGRSGGFMLGLWASMILLSGVFAILGALLFGDASPMVRALVSCVAAGGIFAMVVETMIPEAFSETHELSGLVAALGFVSAVLLQLISG